MKKEKILITGPRGLLGSVLLKYLRDLGHRVSPLDVDIRDKENLKEFERENFDWVIHTATLTNVDLCEKDNKLCYDTNVSGTRNVLELAKKLNTRFIYISTASVFSGFEGNYKESVVPYPKNFYNISKVLAEEIVKSYDKSLILRLNLIGIHPEGSRGKNFFEWLVDSIKENKDLQLFTDVMMNPLSPQTIAGIIDKLISLKVKDKVLHIGTSDHLSKAEVAKLVMERLGYKGKAKFISIDEISQGIVRPKQMWLNTDYIQKTYAIKMPTLESEVDKILKNAKLH